MSHKPVRGELWDVRFDPSEGDEIKKIRPAIVVSHASAGRMQLLIVVPVIGWQPNFSRYFWMVRLAPLEQNGLSKESVADCFQVKSISTTRFQRRLGVVTSDELAEITAAIALCIGYSS